MKIAFFSDTFFPQINGVSKTLGRFSNYLHSNNIEHQIFAPSNDQEKFANVSELLSVPFAFYPECRFSLPNIFRIHNDLQKFKPDIIHSATEFNIGFSGMNYAKKNQIAFTTSFHTNFPDYLKYYRLESFQPFLWNYLCWFHQKSDLVLCPSHSTLQTLETKGFSNLSVWSRGIDSHLFSPKFRSEAFLQKYSLTDKIVLLYVGRVSPEKNLPALNKAYRKLQTVLGDSIALIITGDGPSFAETKQSFPDDVIFTGYKQGQELSEIYASADIFTFPSITETFGNVVLEAMASGLPVVSFDQGGVRDNVINNVNGFQADYNMTDDFFQKIKDVIDNKPLRQKLSSNAFLFASNKDWDQIFNNVIASYSDLLQKNNSVKKISA